MQNQQRGVTLVEMLVAFFIFSLISFTLYEVLSRATHARTVSEARSHARQESGKILSLMQADLAQAVKGSFEQPDMQTVRIKVNVKGSKKPKKLEYSYSPPVLKRRFQGRIWRVSNYVDTLTITQVPNATGQVILDLKTSVLLPGLRPEEAQTYEQRQVMVLREDMAAARDPHWRDVGDVDKFFQTQGNLLAGVKEDASQIVQDVSKMCNEIANEVKNQTIGQIKKAKEGLIGGLNRAKDQLSSLDDQILGLSPEAIFDLGGAGSRLWGSVSGRNKRLKKKAEQLKSALAKMKKAGQLDWATLDKIVGSDKGRLRSTIRKMYEGKEELFKAGNQILGAMDDLKITVTAADGIDTTIWKP